MQGVEQICQGRKMVHIFCKQFRHFLLSNVTYQLIVLLCSSQSQLHVFSISSHSASRLPVPQTLAVMFHSLNKAQSISPQITCMVELYSRMHGYLFSATKVCTQDCLSTKTQTHACKALGQQQQFLPLFYLFRSFSLFHCSSRTMFTSLNKQSTCNNNFTAIKT